MKGLDGIQGPVYVGTGCVFNRQALYGYGPSSLTSLPKASSSSSCCCCCPRKKQAKEKDPSELYRDAKREDLNAAIFNLREIESKFFFDPKRENLTLIEKLFQSINSGIYEIADSSSSLRIIADIEMQL